MRGFRFFLVWSVDGLMSPVAIFLLSLYTLIVRHRHGHLATLKPFQRWKLSEVGLSAKVTTSTLIISLHSLTDEGSGLCVFPFTITSHLNLASYHWSWTSLLAMVEELPTTWLLYNRNANNLIIWKLDQKIGRIFTLDIIDHNRKTTYGIKYCPLRHTSVDGLVVT